MKLAVLALLTLLSLAIDSCARPAYGETGNRLNYIVDVRNPAGHHTPVSLELVVNQGPTQIAFVTKPTPRARQDEAKRLKISTVSDSSGRPLNTEHPGPFLWRVTRTDNNIRINYTVDWIQPHAVPGRPDFEAYLGTWGGYIKEYFLLVRPVLRIDIVTVKFLLPDGWSLITPHDFADSTTYSFPGNRFQYFGTMWAALVAVGTPKVLTRFQAGGVQGEIFSYADTLTTTAHTLADRFSTVLTYYHTVFGGSIFKRYVIVIGDPDYFPLGLGALASQPLRADRVDTLPHVLTRDQHPFRPAANAWMNIVHNVFHSWLRAAIFPAVEPNAPEATKSWFYEGVADYYAALAMLKSGMWSQSIYDTYYERTLAVVNSFYTGQYEVPLPVTPKYLAESGDIGYMMINYYKGNLIAYILNHTISDLTGQKATLDDVMKVMFKNHALTGLPFTNRDILLSINAVSNVDFSDFFKKFVYGSERLPLQLGSTGIRVDPSVRTLLRPRP